MARKNRGFVGSFDTSAFDVAVNNVAADIGTMLPSQPGGIGGTIPKMRGNAMQSSIKMGGPRGNSFVNAALGTMPQGMGRQMGGLNLTKSRGIGNLGSVKPVVGSSGGGMFGTNAGSSFWNNVVGNFNTTDRMGRQWLESEAKRKAAEQQQKGSGNNSVTGGDASQAQSNRVQGALQHKDLLMRVSEESGVPWQVLAATMALESGGQNLGTNPAGATGLMQVVGHYAESGEPLWQPLADKYGGDLNDPYTNVRTAADIMQMGYDKYGSWEKAAAWYFGGGGAFNSDGSYSMNADMYGTDIGQYVNVWKNNFAAVSGGGSGSGVNHSGEGLVFPVKGYEGGLDLHWGEHPGAVDIFAPPGTDVLAINGGSITSGFSEIGGYWSMVTGDDGLLYYYAHQDRMGPNGRIEKGGYIGGVGNTGNAASTPHHLHLGIATQGHGIINGAGPSGGAGDINMIDFLNGTYRY